MKFSYREKAARKAAFYALSPEKKLEHIVTYYKWPILLCILALVIVGSSLHRQLTKKEPVLYLALINTSIGKDLEEDLTSGYLADAGLDSRKKEIYLYNGLYFSDNADTLNHQYAYASKIKLTGAISTKKLDLVLMNREGYDLLSRKGYLMDLSSLSDNESSAFLTENEVVLSDNTLEVLLGEADEEQRVTETIPNAIEADTLPLFQNASFDGSLYLGILANTERLEEALRYIQYLFDAV